MQTRRPSSLFTDPHLDMARRASFHSSVSADYPDRDLKRRRMSQNVDEVYLVNASFRTRVVLHTRAIRVCAPPLCLLIEHCKSQSPSQTPSPPTTEALARPSNFSPPPLNHGGYLPSSSNNTSAYSSPGLNSSNSMLSSGLQNGPVSYQLPAMSTPSSTSTPTSYSASTSFP